MSIKLEYTEHGSKVVNKKEVLSLKFGQFGLEYYELDTKQQYILAYDRLNSWKAEGKVTDAQRKSYATLDKFTE